MKKRIIEEKALAFGIRITKMVRVLTERKAKKSILDQILRSGTSIGANVAEGSFAQSTADYITKHQIAAKEAHETEYWLNILHEDQMLTDAEHQSMLADLIEIKKILTRLLKTAKGIK